MMKSEITISLEDAAGLIECTKAAIMFCAQAQGEAKELGVLSEREEAHLVRGAEEVKNLAIMLQKKIKEANTND